MGEGNQLAIKEGNQMGQKYDEAYGDGAEHEEEYAGCGKVFGFAYKGVVVWRHFICQGLYCAIEGFGGKHASDAYSHSAPFPGLQAADQPDTDNPQGHT